MSDFKLKAEFDLDTSKAMDSLGKVENHLNKLFHRQNTALSKFSENTNHSMFPAIIKFDALTSVMGKAIVGVAAFTYGLTAAVKAASTLVHYSEDMQRERNNMQSLVAVLFHDKLNKGTVSIAESKAVAENLVTRSMEVANKYGLKSSDILGMNKALLLPIVESANQSISSSLNFMAKFERAMPVLAMATNPDVAIREMSSLLSGKADSSMPLWYKDFQPLLQMDTKKWNTLSSEDRFQQSMLVLDKLGSRTESSLNLISGQWDVVNNHMLETTSKSFSAIQKYLVDVLQSLNKYMGTNDFKETMDSVAQAFKVIGKASITFFDTWKGLDTESVTWGDRFKIIGQDIKSVADSISKIAGFFDSMFWVVNKVNTLLGKNDRLEESQSTSSSLVTNSSNNEDVTRISLRRNSGGSGSGDKQVPHPLPHTTPQPKPSLNERISELMNMKLGHSKHDSTKKTESVPSKNKNNSATTTTTSNTTTNNVTIHATVHSAKELNKFIHDATRPSLIK